MRPSSVAALLLCLLASPGAVGLGRLDEQWSEMDDGDGMLRRTRFYVADGACAYRLMAEPKRMERAFSFIEEAQVRRDTGREQEVLLRENFFPVGQVESSYDRQLDGSRQVQWHLIAGRQKRHEGTWQVTPEGKGARIDFDNTIEAKSWIHQAILTGIQRRSMRIIVDATQKECGIAPVED